MALYRFGFKRIRPDGSSSSQETPPIAPNGMPSLEEARSLGLGEVEYGAVINNTSEILSAWNKKQRCTRGKYLKFSDVDRAKIGKYALENVNERARQKFLEKYPTLTESTVRNFKKAYKGLLESELKKANPQPVCKNYVLTSRAPTDSIGN